MPLGFECCVAAGRASPSLVIISSTSCQLECFGWKKTEGCKGAFFLGASSLSHSLSLPREQVNTVGNVP